MNVAILGATGTIGSAVLERALAAGHGVRALARDPSRVSASPGLTVVTGDARDPDSVMRVIEGADAVIALVGPRRNTPDAVTLLEAVAENVVRAMRAQHLTRLVFVAGAGVAMPGERRTVAQRVASALVRRLARWVVEAKERETAIYRESGLDWTAVRPVRVRKGPATGRAMATLEPPRSFFVTSADLADVIVTVLADARTIRTAPYVSR